MSSIDFLAIGDITTDAFIRLAQASVTHDPKTEAPLLCMPFAEKLPYESVDVIAGVGNSPNAAVSAARLGLKSALLANLGGDQNGKDSLTALKQNSVITDYMSIEKDKQSNYHYVLWYEADRTILVKHQHYNYQFPQDMPAPRWIYLSSLGANTEDYHEQIATFLKNNPETKLAFQPGTFQINLGAEHLSYLYKRCEVFIVNKEEAQRILKTEEKDTLTLLKAIHELGPYIVLITDGPNGAHCYTEGQVWFMPIYPDPKAPFERTGAGDAYASTFVSALALGKSIEQALMWAPINSMSVVQYVGAQKGLLTQPMLNDFLTKAPKEYAPKKI